MIVGYGLDISHQLNDNLNKRLLKKINILLFLIKLNKEKKIFVYKSVNFVLVDVLISSRKSTRCLPNELIEFFFPSLTI